MSRPLASYAKVQAIVSRLRRNRRWQLRRPRVRSLRYLDLGCGRNLHEDFINLDFAWHPGVDLCWNILEGLPFPDQSLDGIFSEHCLEHFTLSEGAAVLNEVRRVLRPHGTLRVVLPDAERYLRNYVQSLDGNGAAFPYPDSRPADIDAPLVYVNRVFYQDRESPRGHRTMYDFRLLKAVLEQAGFPHAARASFRQGRDERLLLDSPAREAESLYVDAWA